MEVLMILLDKPFRSSESLLLIIPNNSLTLLGVTSVSSVTPTVFLPFHLFILALSRAKGSLGTLSLSWSQILFILEQKKLFIWSAIALGLEMIPESVVKMVGDKEDDHPANLLTLFHICLPVISSSTIFCSFNSFFAVSFLSKLFTLFFSLFHLSQSTVEFVLLAILLNLFLFLIL